MVTRTTTKTRTKRTRMTTATISSSPPQALRSAPRTGRTRWCGHGRTLDGHPCLRGHPAQNMCPLSLCPSCALASAPDGMCSMLRPRVPGDFRRTARSALRPPPPRTWRVGRTPRPSQARPPAPSRALSRPLALTALTLLTLLERMSRLTSLHHCTTLHPSQASATVSSRGTGTPPRAATAPPLGRRARAGRRATMGRRLATSRRVGCFCFPSGVEERLKTETAAFSERFPGIHSLLHRIHRQISLLMLLP